MKRVFLLLLAVILLNSCDTQKNYIEVETPVRPSGQTDLIEFTTPKMDVVRVGFIGLGMRGPGAVERFTHIPGVEIKALCDLHADRAEKAQQILKKANLPEATLYSGSEDAWKELCERDDIDLVYIMTDWKRHAPMMIYAMEQGKHVACEVPAAMNLEEIWDVVNTAERTKRHCMQLENCVYDFFELTTLNMAQKGVFGEVLHTQGAYIHDLVSTMNGYESDWRLIYNRDHAGDVYPTHGLGPACQLLDIHRGDRMKFLVSMDTKTVTYPEFMKKHRGQDGKDFKNGDHTLTMIQTENGKTIHLQHNIATPRPYDRMYQLTATKGFANKYPVEGYAIEAGQVQSDDIPNHENLNAHGFVSNETKAALMNTYKHRIHVELEEKAREVGGHGGMDYIMDYRMIYCLRNGLPLDMDVYDLAEWCSIIPLTELSIENNSMPVEIPDFTRGSWNKVKGYRHAFAD